MFGGQRRRDSLWSVKWRTPDLETPGIVFATHDVSWIGQSIAGFSVPHPFFKYLRPHTIVSTHVCMIQR